MKMKKKKKKKKKTKKKKIRDRQTTTQMGWGMSHSGGVLDRREAKARHQRGDPQVIVALV